MPLKALSPRTPPRTLSPRMAPNPRTPTPPSSLPTPLPPQTSTPDMPEFLQQFVEEGWFKDIYPDELELKVEHDGDSGTFLNLDIWVEEGRFVYKLYDKRDAFPFSIVRMSYLCSNIPRKIFCSALVGEFLRIARATLRVSDFIPKGIDLVHRMVNQGGDRKSVEHFLLKIIRRHPDSFSQFRFRPEDLIQKCFPN